MKIDTVIRIGFAANWQRWIYLEGQRRAYFYNREEDAWASPLEKELVNKRIDVLKLDERLTGEPNYGRPVGYRLK